MERQPIRRKLRNGVFLVGVAKDGAAKKRMEKKKKNLRKHFFFIQKTTGLLLLLTHSPCSSSSQHTAHCRCEARRRSAPLAQYRAGHGSSAQPSRHSHRLGLVIHHKDHAQRKGTHNMGGGGKEWGNILCPVMTTL